ncbi:MAG TPA: hypothetical protein VHA33_03425 [Candidatus Angelobacter sp.]|jgi:hypothetical protein|nr:hypothetical protein [Candidatus Angelobacter sp.]
MASPGTGAATRQAPPVVAAVFQLDQFIARQKIWTFTPKFYFHDLNGNTLAFLRKKVFTLKDEIRVFTDENQSMELLHIKARKIIDWGTAFDVTDSINRQKVGVIKRQGWKSIVRKEWTIMDANEQEICTVKEDSLLLATLRRYLINIIPQSYIFEAGGRQLGTAKQNWNLFVLKMMVDFSGDPAKQLDRRLVAAAVVLLMAVEGRQRSYD